VNWINCWVHKNHSIFWHIHCWHGWICIFTQGCCLKKQIFNHWKRTKWRCFINENIKCRLWTVEGPIFTSWKKIQIYETFIKWFLFVKKINKEEGGCNFDEIIRRWGKRKGWKKLGGWWMYIHKPSNPKFTLKEHYQVWNNYKCKKNLTVGLPSTRQSWFPKDK
jgi:hypothetical protein